MKTVFILPYLQKLLLETVDLQLKTIIDARAKFYCLDQLFLKK